MKKFLTNLHYAYFGKPKDFDGVMTKIIMWVPFINIAAAFIVPKEYHIWLLGTIILQLICIVLAIVYEYGYGKGLKYGYVHSWRINEEILNEMLAKNNANLVIHKESMH